MIVVISDLHFTDGSTSNWKDGIDQFNVSPQAFRLLIASVSGLIQRRDTTIDKENGRGRIST